MEESEANDCPTTVRNVCPKFSDSKKTWKTHINAQGQQIIDKQHKIDKKVGVIRHG